jgi:hypothetical protein
MGSMSHEQATIQKNNNNNKKENYQDEIFCGDARFSNV